MALGIGGLVVVLRSKWRTRKALAATFAFCAVAGALLTTYWASWFWSHLVLLQYMQFPWRALLLPGLFLPLLAIFALERLGPRWSAAVLIVLVAINLPQPAVPGEESAGRHCHPRPGEIRFGRGQSGIPPERHGGQHLGRGDQGGHESLPVADARSRTGGGGHGRRPCRRGRRYGSGNRYGRSSAGRRCRRRSRWGWWWTRRPWRHRRCTLRRQRTRRRWRRWRRRRWRRR